MLCQKHYLLATLLYLSNVKNHKFKELSHHWLWHDDNFIGTVTVELSLFAVNAQSPFLFPKAPTS
jgi:hypothetical protein